MADVLGFLKKGFPFLSAGLSLVGPAGNLAASLIGSVLKVDQPTVQSVTKALQNLTLTPDQQQALQQAEQQFKAQMAQMGYQHVEELEQIAAQDRASARQMQVVTRSWIPGTMSIIVTIGFFGLLVVSMFHVVPAGSEKVIDVMTGSLGTAWIMIITYYFGSSAGSARKTELLTNNGGNNR